MFSKSYLKFYQAMLRINSFCMAFVIELESIKCWASLVAQRVKASACNVGDLSSIPGLGRYPGERNGNPFQYSCLENPMDREAWWATVHGVAKSQTRLSDFTFTFFFLLDEICTEFLFLCFSSDGQG